MRLIHRPQYRCHCGVEVFEVETVQGRTMCSWICRACNPWWIRQSDIAYHKARKQAEGLQEAGS